MSIHHNWQTLTATEKRVLRELLNGHTSRQTASLLFISPRTVDNHKANISAKLGIAGGPHSLARFVLVHRDQVALLVSPDEASPHS